MEWKRLTVGAVRRLWGTAPVFAIPALVLVSANLGASASQPPGAGDSGPVIERLEARMVALSTDMGALEERYREDVAPVEQVLRPFHEDERWIRRIAIALVREAEAVDMDPRVLASVLLVEDPWLDPAVRSSQGATGLMQVMPFHAGRWGCASADLVEAEANICHGARIFASYLRRNGGDLDRALLAYNGCVNGTNTPDCHTYPGHVYARAGRAALQRWLTMD
jgi:hypothetical protein